VASFTAARGLRAQGDETTPAKLELNRAVGSSQTKEETAMAKKKKKKKKSK
jgi:hypothetical protein